MPACSVVVCKNTSSNVNYVNDGISFHIYPKDPKIKLKWINATGKGPNWFPTKTSAICSSHFERKCFRPLKKVRRLFECSVPTLMLRTRLINYVEPSTSKPYISTELNKNEHILTVESNFPMEIESQNVSVDQNYILRANPISIIYEDDADSTPRNISRTHSDNIKKDELNETPRKRKLRQLISVQKKVMKKQKSQIKRLQKKTSRYRKKIANLKEILQNLKEKNYIGADHVTQLENFGVTDLKQRYEENVSSGQNKIV